MMMMVMICCTCHHLREIVTVDRVTGETSLIKDPLLEIWRSDGPRKSRYPLTLHIMTKETGLVQYKFLTLCFGTAQ